MKLVLMCNKPLEKGVAQKECQLECQRIELFEWCYYESLLRRPLHYLCILSVLLK